MQDVTLEEGDFQPRHGVLHRLIGVIINEQGNEIRWTKAQNLSGLNSSRFKQYISYCITKSYVKVEDLGHRHRIIRLEERGKIYYETMKTYI
jgi:hypothetical protein